MLVLCGLLITKLKEVHIFNFHIGLNSMRCLPAPVFLLLAPFFLFFFYLSHTYICIADFLFFFLFEKNIQNSTPIETKFVLP